MFDKYLYALGRGVRGAKKAFDAARAGADDPAQTARDVTPQPGEPEIQPPPPATRQRQPDPSETDAVLARIPLVLGARPLVMGVVNVTPDSFSDGGRYLDHRAAVEHGLRLVREGADILDVGGESTRPSATPVSEDEEIARAIPVIRGLASQTSQPISIDTMKAKVAEQAIAAGATIINDVWGFQRDQEMAHVAAAHDVHCVLMHNRYSDDPQADMFAEVRDFLARSIDMAMKAGVKADKIILDPGIGFGKDAAQGFELVRRLAELKKTLGYPILLGVSRKRLIGAATGKAVPAERDAGSIAAGLYGAMQGADIVRVHDVAGQADAFRVLAAIEGRNSRTGKLP